MHRLNSEPFHVDLVKSIGIFARIDSVDSIDYSEEDDGDFSCTITIQGTVSMRPPGDSISDSVGVVLGTILEADVSDSDIKIVFTTSDDGDSGDEV